MKSAWCFTPPTVNTTSRGNEPFSHTGRIEAGETCKEQRVGLKRPIMAPAQEKLAWVVPAAGRGTRLGSELPKALVPAAGRPLVAWTLRNLLAAQAAPCILLLPEEAADDPAVRKALLAALPRHQRGHLRLLAGGATRRASVQKGLAALPRHIALVGIHDGARPLVSADLVERLLVAAERTGAATAALPVRDTIRAEGAGTWQSLPRQRLHRIQTPQMFTRQTLERALLGTDDTDDRDEASTVQDQGLDLELVPGDPANIKVTDPDDLRLVHRILTAESLLTRENRTALGLDAHRLVAGIPLMLGGLRLEYAKGLEGHSDGDVLCHAVADALLSGARLGDLGRHFPSSDPAFKGISGLEILTRTRRLLQESGWSVDSVDATVIGQEPAISPHRHAMEQTMAQALGIGSERITVKATTTDFLGFTGRGEGIAAQAVVVVSKRIGSEEIETNPERIEDAP